MQNHLRRLWTVIAFLTVAATMNAHPALSQVPKANEDESLVVMAPLPDPLLRVDGKRIFDSKEWPAQRARWMQLIAEHEYGIAPSEKADLSWVLVEQGLLGKGGRVHRAQRRDRNFFDIIHGSIPFCRHGRC